MPVRWRPTALGTLCGEYKKYKIKEKFESLPLHQILLTNACMLLSLYQIRDSQKLYFKCKQLCLPPKLFVHVALIKLSTLTVYDQSVLTAFA